MQHLNELIEILLRSNTSDQEGSTHDHQLFDSVAIRALRELQKKLQQPTCEHCKKPLINGKCHTTTDCPKSIHADTYVPEFKNPVEPQPPRNVKRYHPTDGTTCVHCGAAMKKMNNPIACTDVYACAQQFCEDSLHLRPLRKEDYLAYALKLTKGVE